MHVQMIFVLNWAVLACVFFCWMLSSCSDIVRAVSWASGQCGDRWADRRLWQLLCLQRVTVSFLRQQSTCPAAHLWSDSTAAFVFKSSSLCCRCPSNVSDARNAAYFTGLSHISARTFAFTAFTSAPAVWLSGFFTCIYCSAFLTERFKHTSSVLDICTHYKIYYNSFLINVIHF